MRVRHARRRLGAALPVRPHRRRRRPAAAADRRGRASFRRARDSRSRVERQQPEHARAASRTPRPARRCATATAPRSPSPPASRNSPSSRRMSARRRPCSVPDARAPRRRPRAWIQPIASGSVAHACVDVAGLARREVALEHVLHVARVPGLDQEAREVRARDQPLAGHVALRAFEGAGDARGGERLARCAARARRGPRGSTSSPATSVAFAGIDAAARRRGSSGPPSSPTAREPGTSVDAVPRGRPPRPRRGPPISSWSVSASTSTPRDAARADDRRRRQQAVGIGRMAVQVVAEHGDRARARLSR